MGTLGTRVVQFGFPHNFVRCYSYSKPKNGPIHTMTFRDPWSRWKRQTVSGTFSNVQLQSQQRDFNSSAHHQWKSAGFTIPGLKYFRSLKWTPIPLSLGFALLAYQHYRRVLRRGQSEETIVVQEDKLGQDWEITCYRMIPWKSLSKAWGWINSVYLPVWSRHYILNAYVKAFNCDITEAEVPDLYSYKNLGEFFRRGLKTGARPVDNDSPLVSPADGTVLHFGKVDCGKIEQVKGVTYSLPAFLGPKSWDDPDPTYESLTMKVDEEEFCSNLLKKKVGTVLHYCVIYLAPGDYHRFHSPATSDMSFRRHFGGELLSVNPKVARWIAGLFSLNERAVYVGSWEHGFFSFTAVGATNVGSIRVRDDPDLLTNSRHVQKNTRVDKYFAKPIHWEKGDEVGEFNLGSTIVILLEAPPTFQFNLKPGQEVKVGQSLIRTNEAAQKTNFDEIKTKLESGSGGDRSLVN